MPAYLEQLPDIRLRGSVRELKSAMEIAKSRAIRENAEVVIWFWNNRYLAYLDDGAGGGTAGDHTQHADEVTVIEGDLPEGVEIWATLFANWNNQTFFDGRGLPPSNESGYVRLKNSKDHYRGIALSMVGHVQIEESTDGGTTWVPVGE